MKALRLILRYIKYLFTARGSHTAQAPFLYEFITHVLNESTDDESCNSIETLRKKLCQSKKEIQITDFGAGSAINNSKTRKIKDISKNSAKNAKFGELLYRIVQFYKPKNIIELGTSLGISTSYLAQADTNANIFTFEGCPVTAGIAQENFDKQNIKNTSITLGDFNLTLTNKLKEILTIDLAFIDGNHEEKPTIDYFKQCLKYANNNTLFVFDDIHWSQGMENAWNYIQEHEKTTLTIDLFFMGIVFVKSELSKENFTIRF